VISYFFIDRPIFASVLSIAITLAGALAWQSLPVDQYPPITPPTVTTSCSYPGANAQTVADTVGAPIEQQVNGLENMLYMSSQSGNDGSYSLTVTFDLGTNVKNALVLVQNRVALAVPQLPSEVQRQTLIVRKKSPSILMIVNLSIDAEGVPEELALFLSNYATLHLKEEIARLPGVGDISVLGQRDYSIRVWLDPEKLAARGITASDVVSAMRSQSQESASGQVGQMPAAFGQNFQLPVHALGRLVEPEQFGEIIIKVGKNRESPSTPIVRLRDVARVELGAQQYDQACKVNRKPAAGIAVYQLPGSNAMETAKAVIDKMEELKTRFPQGMTYGTVYDTTPFIEESINEVYKTLGEAVILVAIVVLVFLQSWRATLIPLAAVPVAIIGTLAAMAALGFSLNNLTLFGLVLAIGIVVDDAIVVVENVERWLAEGLAPREATRKAMDEVTGPVVAVALVLCAVFVPCAFLGGIIGQFFRQFAVTIAVSTVLSAFNSLTLSPALAALLLRPHGAKQDLVTRFLNVTLGWFFWLFNRGFDKGTRGYAWVVGRSLRLSALVLLLYAGLLVLTYWSFRAAPSGFIPAQDKGRFLVNLQLPDATSLQHTQVVIDRMEEIALKTPGVVSTMSYSGRSLLGGGAGTNFGSMYVMLDKFENRLTPELSAAAIRALLTTEFKKLVPEGVVKVMPPAPVDGVSAAGGFKFLVEDRGDLGTKQLQDLTNRLIGESKKEPNVQGMFTMTTSNPPQLFADIDRTKVKSMGINLDDLTSTLQIYLGSMYVNNFNEFGRSWQVTVQADKQFRNQPESINQLKVRNSKGQMVPLGTVVEVHEISGPALIARYNLYPAVAVNGNPAPGVSSGQAIDAVDTVAFNTLPRTMAVEWTELAFLEKRAGNTAMYTFALAIAFVFLVLAALYESWTLPLAVILVVPLCLLSSVVGVLLVPGADVNIFTQIGFVVLVGLASKNAILIVEFAKQLHEEGQPLYEATTVACRMRLRPILMTSFAFILGVWPLVVAHGAGSEMRQALGLAVFAGMLGVTMFGIFLTPVFFYVIQGFGDLAVLNTPWARRLGFALFLLLNIPLFGLPFLLIAVLGHALKKPHTPHAPPSPPLNALGTGLETSPQGGATSPQRAGTGEGETDAIQEGPP
jgi:hydrophobe/amphiphile efflux-1 (HAE1) family protein